jgi:hypothetical protein
MWRVRDDHGDKAVHGLSRVRKSSNRAGVPRWLIFYASRVRQFFLDATDVVSKKREDETTFMPSS